MKERDRAFGIMAAVVTAAFIVSKQATSGSVLRAPELALQGEQSACATPPQFRVVYDAEKGGVQLKAETLNFLGNGVVEAVTCGPGKLELTVSGDEADGVAPRLEISLNNHVIGSYSTIKPRTWQVNLPEAGRLSLAYFNDYYAADVRIAVLEAIELNSAACSTSSSSVLTLELGKGSADSWLSQDAAAYLVTDQGVTVKPCGNGTLTARIWGKPGGKQYPVFSVVQDGKTLIQARTSEKRQYISFEISSSPLRLFVQNPYARLLGDRNLYIKRWKFTGDATP